MAEQFEALGLIGKIAAIVCMLAAIYAIVSAGQLLPHMKKFNELGFDVWTDSDLRPKFLRFLGFCALTVVAASFGFAFGGWPTQ